MRMWQSARTGIEKVLVVVCVVALVLSQTSLLAFAADAVFDSDGAATAVQAESAQLGAQADGEGDGGDGGGGEPAQGGDPADPNPDPDPDPNPDPDPDPDPQPDPAAALTVTVKLANQGTGADGAFLAGETARFDIELKNAGDAASAQVTVRELLDGAAFEKDESDDPAHVPAWTVDEQDAGKPAIVPALAPGATVVVRAAYRVSESDAAAGSFSNKVSFQQAGDASATESAPLSVACAQGGSAPVTPTGPSIADFAVGYGPALSGGPVFVSERGQTVQLGIVLTWSDFSVSGADRADMTVTWVSSDPEVATVDASGLVTPQGKDGFVIISAYGRTSSPATAALAGSIYVYFENQQEDAEILLFYSDGTLVPQYGSGSTISFDQVGSTFAKEVYATVEIGGVEYSSRDADSGFEFQVENIEMANCYHPGSGSCYVWASDRGYDGTTTLIVAFEHDGIRRSRWVPINVNAGNEYTSDDSGIVPAALTVSVSWEADPNPQDPTITEHVYSMEQLNEMAGEYRTYTLIGDPDSTRKYAYQVARGVRLVALLNDCGIYEQDVKYLDVKATDEMSVNSATMGMSYFLGSRYYYPNFYLGRNTSGAVAVPAMIALSDRVYWNARAETIANKVNTYAELSSGVGGTAPRLCIGANAPLVTGGRISVRNIETIHVVLAGAPPANPDVYGTGDGEGTGDGGEGGGSGTGSGTGASDWGAAAGSGSGSQSGEDIEGNSGVDAGGADVESESPDNGGGSTGEGETPGGKEPESWKVYQMMSAAQTQAPISDIDNKWWPFALPMADVAIGAGALRYLVWFRREKAQPQVGAAL